MTQQGNTARKVEAAPRLTKTEEENLGLLTKGFSNRMIADARGISRKTVKSELKRLFRKINVANRTQAAVLATKLGLTL